MVPLSDFCSSTDKLPREVEPNVNINLDIFNKDIFESMIPYIPQMDDKTLYAAIKNNTDVIFNNIMDYNPNYISLFTDHRFISMLSNVMETIPIDYKASFSCNKIAYDYFTSDNPDPNIKAVCLKLSRTVNRQTIQDLTSIGLPEDIAANLAFCRYSSVNEQTNVKRLNFVIYNKDPDIMTEQMIVWIYEKLFTRISDLFQGTMFDTTAYEDDNFMEVYGTVGLAVLLILNNMPKDKIKKVLMLYNNAWEYAERPRVRFSLHALSGDYARIRDVVQSLEFEGIVIP